MINDHEKKYNNLKSGLEIDKILLSQVYSFLDELVKFAENETIIAQAIAHREKLNVFIGRTYGSRIDRDKKLESRPNGGW